MGIQCIGLHVAYTGNLAVFIDSYLTNFACGCSHFAVFSYREFISGCMECTVAVYKERHGPIPCHLTYVEIVFGIQCIDIINIGIKSLYLAHSHNASKSECS